MSLSSDSPFAGGPAPPAAPAATTLPAMVQVWDFQVRAFHWSLVVLFIVAYMSADGSGRLHRFAGYCIAGLLVLRVAWGFVGSQHARFSDFVRSPRAVLDYVKLTIQHRAPRSLGHNPAGGAMTIALMLMVGGVCLTGHLMTTAAWWGSETMEDIHKVLTNGTLGLIVLHLLGNFRTGREHSESLTTAMITGMKRTL